MFQKEIVYVKDILYSKGYKLTKQRKEIILFFLENPEKHFSPLELHVKVKNKGQLVSIATIYRNIRVLKNNNIIEEVTYREERLYELKIFGKKSIHVHTSCIKCNKITNHVDCRASLEIIQKINRLTKNYSLEISKVEIFSSGICYECLKGR